MNLKRYIDACIRKAVKYKFLDASVFDMFKYAITGIARGAKGSLTRGAKLGTTVDPFGRQEGFFEEGFYQIDKFHKNALKKIQEAQQLRNSGDFDGDKQALSSVGNNAKLIKHIYSSMNGGNLKGFPISEYNNLFKYVNNVSK